MKKKTLMFKGFHSANKTETLDAFVVQSETIESSAHQSTVLYACFVFFHLCPKQIKQELIGPYYSHMIIENTLPKIKRQ